MSDLANLLQERLTQFEEGAPLEDCLEGLPEEEAALFKLAVDMRQVYLPVQSEGQVAAQYQYLIQVASQEKTVKPITSNTSSNLVAWIRQQFDLLFARKEIVFGLAGLAVVVVLIFAGWLAQNRANDEPSIAAVTTATVTSETGGTETAENQDTTQPTPAVPVATTAAPNPVAVAEANHQLFVPIVADPLTLNPQTAVLETMEGVTEIQNSDGTWTAVSHITTATAGQRIRTRTLSKATITFFDGSQATLGANSEISLDTVEAQRPESGFRTVVLTQWVGESDHAVQFRNDGGSRYEVKTPSGSGVARGTFFQVLVTADSFSRFTVMEGKVDVTGQNVTVPVTAGQLTNIVAGSPPEEPLFRISGEGEVSQIGAVWVIAGQSFLTHNQTIFIGNPQVGDLVQVEGHLTTDGEKVADLIILIQRDARQSFTLVGVVEEITEAAWVVAGQTIVVNEASEIEEGIVVGNHVWVNGRILPGGALLAEHIHLETDDESFPFQFTGVVQIISADFWRISGVEVVIDANTEIEADIVVGDVVQVRGTIQENGRWLAHHIEQEDDDGDSTFELVGVVQNIDPWQVAGTSFETRTWTDIEPGIEVGSQVRVRGVILPNGTWVANDIDLLDDNPANIIVFVGVVNSINPWVIHSFPLIVNDQTILNGNITVGTVVSVRAQLQPDGTWLALRIHPVHPHFGIGCLWLNTVVIGFNNNILNLRHWGNVNLNEQIVVQGDIQTNSIIALPFCVGWDGTIIIVGNIVVIYQPIIIIINDGNNGGGNQLPPGCKITGIGNGNPHVKCSRKSSN